MTDSDGVSPDNASSVEDAMMTDPTVYVGKFHRVKSPLSGFQELCSFDPPARQGSRRHIGNVRGVTSALAAGIFRRGYVECATRRSRACDDDGLSIKERANAIADKRKNDKSDPLYSGMRWIQ